MTLKEISKINYLSCVEAYFGAWIEDYVPVAAFYQNSYIPWGQIVNDFSNSEVSYANYTGIERIQDFAERIGFVSHKKTREIPISLDKKNLTLVSVNDKFFKSVKPWRSDHYIAINKYGTKEISYINEYPLEEGKISIEDFPSVYGGDCIEFEIVGTGREINGLMLANMVRIDHPDFIVLLSPIRLRDAIGILRVSRKRMVEWSRWSQSKIPEQKIMAMMDQIKVADKYYFLLQSMILRKQPISVDQLREIIVKLGKYEMGGFAW